MDPESGPEDGERGAESGPIRSHASRREQPTKTAQNTATHGKRLAADYLRFSLGHPATQATFPQSSRHYLSAIRNRPRHKAYPRFRDLVVAIWRDLLS